jgi:hypothetical protein
MSTPAGDPVLELEYPKAFAAAFAPTLVSHGKRFRYLHLTGALAEQDQNKALWIVPAMRRVKVRCAKCTVAVNGMRSDLPT